jgi:hypothetical protein
VAPAERDLLASGPMRALGLFLVGVAASLAVAACKHDGGEPGDAGNAGDAGDTCSGAVLFGRPNAETGLTSAQCQPECTCGGTLFAPPDYSAAFIQSLLDDWQLSTPYPPLATDPYTGPPPTDDPPGTVCAVLPQGASTAAPRPYTLVTYASQDAVTAAGGYVTHFGHCGVCSTLANLAVYMQNDDLTAPARACALTTEPDGGSGEIPCLMQLGFDLPCAQAWAYDADHTRSVCLATCLADPSSTYNQPDGSLDVCIQCDQDQSGAVFQAVAGRTRRNSGIPNAICRPCSQVQPLVHQY